MKRIFFFTLPLFLSLFPAQVFPQAKGVLTKPAIPGVAVVNFTNNTGDSSLKGLSSSIPEAVSGSLSQFKGIRLVERQNMSKVLNEVELQMSGMFDPDQTVKIGKMAKADILIIGSFGGNSGKVVLTIKAVDVATGRVLDGKLVQGPSSRIHDMASQAAISIAAVISGNNIGYISVSTNPDGSDVYIDGLNVGRSPVFDVKVAAGKHSVSAVKEDYIEAESTIDVGINAHEKWMPTLPSKSMMNRSQWTLGMYAYEPVSPKAQLSALFALAYGKTFEHVYLGGELMSGWIQHDQDLKMPFSDDPITHQRMYVPVLAGIHLNVSPFLSWRYFSPYAGVFAQCGYVKNYQKEKGEYVDDIKTEQSFIYSFGPAVGINFLPYSKISLFVEGRFSWHPESTERYEYVAPKGFAGAATLHKSSINLSGFCIGGGLTYYLD
jgi:TolB-like protein